MKKMTDADKAKLKRLAAGKGARSDGGLTSDQKLELLGLRDMERKSRSYSPAPMSAAAKKKAAAAGKATGAKTKPKSVASKVGGAAGSVAKRAKTTAREARDVVTAVGTLGKAVAGKSNLVEKGRAKKYAVANLKKQVKETAKAAVTGKKGTTSETIKSGIGSALGQQGSKGQGYNRSRKRK